MLAPSPSESFPSEGLPSTGSSSSAGDARSKTGRPNKWTLRRQRQLARVYLYSTIKREDIPKVLREDDWEPGKESTVKAVNNLLDNQPRWLRPKNREEMDRGIACLSERANVRRAKRDISQKTSPLEEQVGRKPGVLNGTSDFCEKPLESLLGTPREQMFSSPPKWADFNQQQFDNSQPISLGSPLLVDSNLLPESLSIHRTSLSDQECLSTCFNTCSMKDRLSRYSATFVLNIKALVETHSISGSSDATITRAAYSLLMDVDADISSSQASLFNDLPLLESSTKIGDMILPDSFLLIDRYKRRQGLCIDGLKSHDLKLCWCAVIEELGLDCRLWVCETGDIMDVPKNLHKLDLQYQDDFGNTVLHFLAARGMGFGIIEDAIGLGADPDIENTAGQTFLHLFPPKFLNNLCENWNDLSMFLQKINMLNLRVDRPDLFGRTFCHVISNSVHRNHLPILTTLLDLFYIPSSRDALGWIPTVGSEIFQGVPNDPLTQGGEVDFLTFPSQPSLGPTFDNALLNHHAGLLKAARFALENPRLEDSNGQNGLQCLAEACLSMSFGPAPTHKSRSYSKRTGEHTEIDELSIQLLQPYDMDEPSMALNGGVLAPIVIMTMDTDDNIIQNDTRKRKKPDSDLSRLTRRFELIQGLVHAGADVNHYDAYGFTVLMAFVNHLPDGENDKIVTSTLQFLISKGADIHRRNRQGETVLHIAIRLGRKVATKALLENGANVHVRTLEGKGLLAVGEKAYFAARHNPQLYASIMACMALASRYGAVASPTPVQEWSMNEGWAPYFLLKKNNGAITGIKTRNQKEVTF